MLRLRKLIPLIGFGAAGLLLGAAGVALATDGNEQIHGCYVQNVGLLRLVDDPASCRAAETAISWNRVGPAGAPGERGLEGPPGETGPPGPAGALAHARVAADGTLDPARSSSNVTAVSRSPFPGTEGRTTLYCFQLAEPPNGIAVTIEDSRAPSPPGFPGPPTLFFSSLVVNATVQSTLAVDFGCESGAEAAVAVTSGQGAPFYVTFS